MTGYVTKTVHLSHTAPTNILDDISWYAGQNSTLCISPTFGLGASIAITPDGDGGADSSESFPLAGVMEIKGVGGTSQFGDELWLLATGVGCSVDVLCTGANRVT